MLNEALALHRNGKLDEAEEIYRNLLDMAPEQTDVLNLLGTLACQKGAFDSALPFLYKAVRLAPDSFQYEFTLAQALQESGRPKEALEHYVSLRKKDPSKPEIPTNIGVVSRRLGHTDDAEKAFLDALGSDPAFAPAKIGLALLYRDAGRTGEAKKLLEDVCAATPDDAEAHFQLSVTLRTLGDTDGALAESQKATVLDPGNALYCNGEGILFERKGDLTAAFDRYDRAIRLAPSFPDAYNNRANILAKQGKHWDAEDDYKKAIKLDPSYAQACNNLGALLVSEDRIEEALEWYRKAFIINPKQPETVWNLGIAVKNAGDPAEAVGLYFNALALDPALTDVHHSIAEALYDLHSRRKEPDLAVKLAKKWVQFFPDNPVAAHVLTALEGGNPAAADPAYVRALFDSFAETFDDTLDRIGYRVPALIEEALADTPDGRRVLDAGCGTGRLASPLRKKASRLDGIDLSPKMIDKARDTGLYDNLSAENITEHLKQKSKAYDLIVFSDTLCYIGDISSVLVSAAEALDDAGEIILTVEKSEKEQPFILRPTGRYAHAERPLRDALAAAGFDVSLWREAVLRREGDADVAGFIVKGRKNTALLKGKLDNADKSV